MVHLALRNDHDHLSVRCLLQINWLPLERLGHLDKFLLLCFLVAYVALLLLSAVALADMWKKLFVVQLLHLLLKLLLLVVLLQLLLNGRIDLLDADAWVFLDEILLLLLDYGGLLSALVLDLLLLLQTLPDLLVGSGLGLVCELWIRLLLDDVFLKRLVMLYLRLLRLVLN